MSEKQLPITEDTELTAQPVEATEEVEVAEVEAETEVVTEVEAEDEAPEVVEESVEEPEAPAEEPVVETVESNIFAEDAVIPPEEDSELLLPPAEEEEKPAPRRRPRGFRIALGIISLLLVIAIGAVLFLYRDGLMKYESSIEEPPLDAYMELIKKQDYETLYASSGFRATELNTKEDYIAYLQQVYSDADKLSVVEEITADKNVRRFSLYNNGTDKLSTLLVTAETVNGKKTWYVTTELTYRPAFTITASEDIDLYIGDTQIALLSSDTIQVAEVQSSFFPFATDVPLPTIYTYTLEGMLMPPQITAAGLSGNECIRIEGENSLLLMLADDEYERALHEEIAFAATGLDVTANELVLSEYSRYSESDFTCTVTATPTTVGEDGIATPSGDSSTYGMSFLSVDGEWKLCSLTVNGETKPLPEATEPAA